MKTISAILGSVLALCSFGLAQAQTQTQTPKKDEKKTISQYSTVNPDHRKRICFSQRKPARKQIRLLSNLLRI